MLTTITLGSCVTVQGIYVKHEANGFVTVRLGDRLYTGRPVRDVRAA